MKYSFDVLGLARTFTIRKNFPMLINIALRIGMIASRTCFIFVAAKFLTLEDLGTYSLLGITVGYSLYMLGLEFYTFTSREIIGANKSKQADIIISQFQFNLVSFVVFFGPLLCIFSYGFLDWKWAVVFYTLLLCEHLSQEIARLMIALEKPLRASFLLFVRTAIWGYALCFLFVFDPAKRSVEWVMYAWIISSFLSVLIGMYWLRFVPWVEFFKRHFSIKWVLKGLKISFPMLISTLAVRGVFTVDRYAVEWYSGLSTLGIYAVYIGVCNALLSFMDSAVFQFTYPRLIGLVNSNDFNGFYSAMNRFAVNVLFCICFIVTGLFLFVELIFGLLHKPEFIEYIQVFWLLVVAHLVLIASYVPHYALFALKKDRWILLAHIFSLIGFGMSIQILSFTSGLIRVSVALIIASLIPMIVKTVVFLGDYRQYLEIREKINCV